MEHSISVNNIERYIENTNKYREKKIDKIEAPEDTVMLAISAGRFYQLIIFMPETEASCIWKPVVYESLLMLRPYPYLRKLIGQ